MNNGLTTLAGLSKILSRDFVLTTLFTHCRLVKVWDYQNKTCVQTLEGHTQNVTFAVFHPDLPIIISGSEDGSVKIWHANTYRLENTLNYGLNRAWAIAYRRTTNDVALGFDLGSVVIKVTMGSVLALAYFISTHDNE
jgi:WD40 repeat protein